MEKETSGEGALEKLFKIKESNGVLNAR